MTSDKTSMNRKTESYANEDPHSGDKYAFLVPELQALYEASLDVVSYRSKKILRTHLSDELKLLMGTMFIGLSIAALALGVARWLIPVFGLAITTGFFIALFAALAFGVLSMVLGSTPSNQKGESEAADDELQEKRAQMKEAATGLALALGHTENELKNEIFPTRIAEKTIRSHPNLSILGAGALGAVISGVLFSNDNSLDRRSMNQETDSR